MSTNEQVSELARKHDLSFSYKVARHGGQVHVWVYTQRFTGKLAIIEENEIQKTVKLCLEA